MRTSVGSQLLHVLTRRRTDQIKSGTFRPDTEKLLTPSTTSTSLSDRQSWTLPAETSIPDPNIYADLENTTSSSAGDVGLPTIAQCAVHLGFLESLYALRQRVIFSTELDEVFDIRPNYRYVDRRGVNTRLKDDTLLPRRQEKWTKFVAMAAVRFSIWWDGLQKHAGEDWIVNDDTLPPLDVLMRRSTHQDDWGFSASKQAESFFSEITGGLDFDLESTLIVWNTVYDSENRLQLIDAASSPNTATSIRTALQSTIKPSDNHLLSEVGKVDASVAQDLAAAVTRQVSFIDKMHVRLWIRSPAAKGTIKRAIERYDNFLKLFKKHPNTMFVPTLDIDIVWHTHQCAPQLYYHTTMEMGGRFVNHDDSIVESKLDTGFEDTKDFWRVHFASDYNICTCWDCQEVLSAVEEAEEENVEPDMEAVARRVQTRINHFRFAETARRKRLGLTQ